MIKLLNKDFMFKNNLKKIFIFILSGLFALSLFSCEDDALLEPQEEEECTGSYCNLSMPNSKNYIASYNPRVF